MYFFEAPDDAGIILTFTRTDVLHVLTGNDHDWQMTGRDQDFAERLLSYNGCIHFLTAYREDDRIRIVLGSLKGTEGMIGRVDRRGRNG